MLPNLDENLIERTDEFPKEVTPSRRYQYNRSHSLQLSDNQDSKSSKDFNDMDKSWQLKKKPSKDSRSKPRRPQEGSEKRKFFLNIQILRNSDSSATDSPQKGDNLSKENHDSEEDSHSGFFSPKDKVLLQGLLPPNGGKLSPFTEKSQVLEKSQRSGKRPPLGENQVEFVVNKRRFKLISRKVPATPPLDIANPETKASPDREDPVNTSQISLGNKSIMSSFRDDGSVRHSQASGQVNFEGKLVINGYELSEVIGYGSFGTVYKARHLIEKKLYVTNP